MFSTHPPRPTPDGRTCTQTRTDNDSARRGRRPRIVLIHLLAQDVSCHRDHHAVLVVVRGGALMHLEVGIVELVDVDAVVHAAGGRRPRHSDHKVACAFGVYEILHEPSARALAGSRREEKVQPRRRQILCSRLLAVMKGPGIKMSEQASVLTGFVGDPRQRHLEQAGREGEGWPRPASLPLRSQRIRMRCLSTCPSSGAARR